MDCKMLIDQRVMHTQTRRKGLIIDISNDCLTVDWGEDTSKYMYPACFDATLVLENQTQQEQLSHASKSDDFERFRKQYTDALVQEIDWLKKTGGKKYQIHDGECLHKDQNGFTYIFETDTEMSFPDNTPIKLWLPDKILKAQIITCEDFTITIHTSENIDRINESVSFTSEQWMLLEALIDRLADIDPFSCPLAHQIACLGRNQINQQYGIRRGQELAVTCGCDNPITFVWGPPGTGKTETLSKIALKHMAAGHRVLMLSYSNVSVDGATIRVKEKSDYPLGKIIRYGYPKQQKVLDYQGLASYQYVLMQNPEQKQRYDHLEQIKLHLNRKEQKYIDIKNELSKIRKSLKDEEKRLAHIAQFVATTVSKAEIDASIYEQKFDVVIFDEVSMAYIPQIAFAASLASKHVICLGDFRQLPAIVQNNNESILVDDIFEHVGIVSAVECRYDHKWLVMLNEQFRMHEDIATFVDKNMYGGYLETTRNIPRINDIHRVTQLSPLSGHSLYLFDLTGTYSLCVKTGDGSHVNPFSAFISLIFAVNHLTRNVLGSNENPMNLDVGIITPYSAQVRLLLAMIRDLSESSIVYKHITCATVHQFQGSERPLIIYDAVDCFYQKYIGGLLTQQTHDIANRLFNVALTRAEGKFVLVANTDYLFNKKLSKKLLFRKLIDELISKKLCSQIVPNECLNILKDTPIKMFSQDEALYTYMQDLTNSQRKISIELVGSYLDEKLDAQELLDVIKSKNENGVVVNVRRSNSVEVPQELEDIARCGYVIAPLTIIDDRIVWYGSPFTTCGFVAADKDIQFEPCIRFEGKLTAKMLRSIFGMN